MSLWLQVAKTRRPKVHAQRKLNAAVRQRYKPRLEDLEDRCLPATSVVAAFGAGPGGGPEVTVVFDDGSRSSFLAFDQSFTGGVSAVLGKVNGTGVSDVIVGAGRGGPSQVAIFDGAQLVAGNVVKTASFQPFPSGFLGGVSLAAGFVNGTTNEDVIVGAGPGGGPTVEVFDGARLAHGNALMTASWAAFRQNFTGGVIVASGHVNGTSHDDVVVGAGRGGSPAVAVFDGSQLAQGRATATASFTAFAPNFTGGVVIALGHVNATKFDDIVVGAGPGGGPNIQVYDGANLAQGRAVMTANFMAFDPRFTGGVSVAVGHILGQTNADVVVGAGPGGGPNVKVFDGTQLVHGVAVAPISFLAYDAGFTGGVQVAVAHNAGTNQDTLVVVAGPGGGPHVQFFRSAALVANNYVPYYSFFAFPFLFTGGVVFGPFAAPFYPGGLFSGWYGFGDAIADPFFDPIMGDSGFFDPVFFDPSEFSNGFFDPGFFDPGFSDPGFFDPGFDPGFSDPGFFDPGFSDPGFFDFGGFDGGGFDFGGFDFGGGGFF